MVGSYAEMTMVEFTAAISALKGALGLVKAAKDLLPNSPDKAASEVALNNAEKAVELAETQIAEQLGYSLCLCSFPPGIALLQPDGAHRCQKCGRDTDEDYKTTMVGTGGY